MLERFNAWQFDEPEEEAAVLAAVRNAAKNDPAFPAWLRALPEVRDGVRGAVIEALVVDPSAHGALLRDELEHALSSAETASEPRDWLLPFWELVEIADGPWRVRFRERIATALRSRRPWIRRWAIELLRDLYDPADPWLCGELQGLLEHDPSWRVRHRAYLTLKEHGQLPPNHRRPLLDRLRARWLSSGLV